MFSGLLLGSSISRKFAAFLEENDLFVPDDDDVDWSDDSEESCFQYFKLLMFPGHRFRQKSWLSEKINLIQILNIANTFFWN